GEAARTLGNTGRGGKAVHPGTLTRWIQIGVRSPDGGRVKLRAGRVGGKWATSAEWLAEVLEGTTAAHLPAERRPPPRSPAARRRAARRHRRNWTRWARDRSTLKRLFSDRRYSSPA